MGRGKRKGARAQGIEKLLGDLRGGVGDDPYGQSAFAGLRGREDAAIDLEMQRLAVDRPTTLALVRKRMSVKKADSLQQVADSTLAAALQHRAMPDEGSRMYASAFRELEPEAQKRLLNAISPGDADVSLEELSDASPRKIVMEQFGSELPDADQQAQIADQATPGTKRLSASDRAKEVARKALEEAGLVPVESVNMDRTLPAPPSTATYIPGLEEGNVVVVESGNDWTKGQKKRGYRTVVTAGDPVKQTAPVTQVEVLESRAGDYQFTGSRERPSDQQLQPENPDFLSTTTTYQPKPGTAPDRVTVDRLTPSEFESLSEGAQRAAARGAELLDALEEFETYNPDFLDSADGKRLTAEITRLGQSHPEAVAYMDNPTLMSRQAPPLGDAVTLEQGRQALPPEMRLTNLTGSDQQARYKLATQAERRAGIYPDIPADAPNRMAWVTMRDAEEATNRNLTLDSYVAGRKASRSGSKSPKKQFAERVDVVLPATQEISERAERGVGGVRRDLDYAPQRRLPEPDVARPEMTAQQEDSLDAQYKAARERAAQPTNAPAAPIEDLTQDPDYYKTLRQVDQVELPGSATGSPSQVKFDRDLALREDRSFIQKWQEKIFRMANESIGADKVGVGDRGLMIGSGKGPGSVEFGEDIGGDMRQAAISEALGVDSPATKKSVGKKGGARDQRKANPLPLDTLVPQWRGQMHFVDGGNVVVRRPNALEVAGFLLDQLDFPDPGMATRLESEVQAAMNAMDATAPTKPRAIRAAGTVFEPSASYRRAMEEQANSRRGIGDQRPLYDEASAIAAKQSTEQVRVNNPKVFGTDDSQLMAIEDGYVAPQAEQTQLVAQNPADTADVTDPTISDAVNAFSKMRRGSSGGGQPTNIGSLIALAGAGLGAGQAFAGEPAGDLPPLEHLAMGNRATRRKASSFVPDPSLAQGASPPPAKPAPRPLPQRPKPQPAARPATVTPATAQAAAPATQPAPVIPAPTAAAAPPPPPAAPPPPPPPAAPPKPPFFNPNDPLVKAAQYASKSGLNPLRMPTLLALLASAPELDKDSWPMKYNPIQGFGPMLYKGYSDMFGGGDTQATPTADPAAMQNQMDMDFQGGVFEESPEEQRARAPQAAPMPIPAMNHSGSNTIEMLRQMLNNPTRMA